jgi:hypothetical protein
MAVQAVTIDSTSWAALALTLTLLGGLLTWVAWRRRGVVAALRALAWTLLPLAAWLTGTLKLAAAVVGDVGHWAVHLVFSPVVWLGIVLAGVSVLLFGATGFLRARGLGSRRPATRRPVERGSRPRPAVADDNDLDDIEAILRKHGIS